MKGAFSPANNTSSTHLFRISLKALEHGVKSVQSCKTKYVLQLAVAFISFLNR